MYIAIDFDGTIVDHRYPDIGPPVPHALYYITKWIEDGAKIILYTIRDGVELLEAIKYLADKGIKLWAVNKNPDQQSWNTSPKIYAHIYIDDAAAGAFLYKPPGFHCPCVNWDLVARFVEDKMGKIT